MTGRVLVSVARPDEVLRMLGQMRGWVMVSSSEEDRAYLLPRIDSCLEAFDDGLADDVRNAGHAEIERLRGEGDGG